MPGGATLGMTFNDCDFGAVADTDGRARSFGAGGGGGGTVDAEFNRCTFGASGGNNQQAWISPAIGGTTVTVNDCEFFSGAGRQIGLGGGGVHFNANRCVFRAGGETVLPDPGSEQSTWTNCVIQFNGGRSIRSGEPGDGRSYIFRHCTFANLDGNPDAHVLDIDPTSPQSEFTNCLFSLPTASNGAVRNAGGPTPAGGGNVVSAAADNNEGLPAGYVFTTDPVMDLDNIHILDSAAAIGAGVPDGVDDDIDGDVRPDPAGSNPDAGADETPLDTPLPPGARVIVVPDDAATINDAINLANQPGDQIVINGDGPFVEALPLHKLAGGNVIRAGDGFTPMIVGDGTINWTDVPNTVSQEAVFLFTERDLVLEGLHLRIDLTGLEAVNGQGYQYKFAGGGRTFEVNDCIFEFFGDPAPGLGILAVNRNMIRIEGGNTITFNRCETRYTMTPLSWPGFNNSIGYFQPGGTTLSITCNDFLFGAVPDDGMSNQGPRARCFGAGGGGGGNVDCEFNRCTFGVGGPFSQQALVSFAIGGTSATFNDCEFLAGAGRQIGLGGGGVFVDVNRSIFRPGGETVLPDPGSEQSTWTNCVIQFDGGRPIRSGEQNDGRSYIFQHCTFVDVGANNPDTHVLDIDPTSPESTFLNCLFDLPASNNGVVRNNGGPAPAGGGNVIRVAADQNEGLPPDYLVARGALLEADDIHLLSTADALGAGIPDGVADDIDGDARPDPAGSNPDAGADENPGDAPPVKFARGDSNADGHFDITDATTTFNWLFTEGSQPPCLDAADADNTGAVNMTDGIFTLDYLFLGGPAPPLPGPGDCDADPEGGDLGCDSFPACEL